MRHVINFRTLAASVLAVFVIGGLYARERAAIMADGIIPAASAATTATVNLPFRYPFTVDGTLVETGKIENSTSPYWWVTSGAMMILEHGRGRTVHDDLPLGSKWQTLYATSNPVDTDGGLHPQNIFRMLTRTRWQDVSHQVSYRIERNNLSASPSRSASNGLLQMTRYADENNLYATGLRVDGHAVIKKKIAGKYHTLAYKEVVPGKRYDRLRNPNLLPLGTWIRMKTVTKNLDAARVSIKLYVDIGNTGAWKLAAEAVDDGKSFGGAAHTQAGYSGLRTDFMDVSFDDFILTSS